MILDEDAVGQRGHHDADDMGSRGCKRACEVVWNISKLSHRSIDAPPHLAGNHLRLAQRTRYRHRTHARARCKLCLSKSSLKAKLSDVIGQSSGYVGQFAVSQTPAR